ncbi:MAG: asparagine synthase (glutamine-hydrolyzing) [Proteobacteria bacterium]|nr:asparagine synthase (glutamine-hydrolyzing) [Pseudomonadota bacterium]
MCGISAIYNYTEGAKPIDQVLLDRLDKLQTFRGPDGNGRFINSSRSLGLAHRRLSIIDITETGAQPMSSPNGRYTITFNGEIYNFKELAEELVRAGLDRPYTSDTSVILGMYEHLGAKMLSRLVGMYALVIWDEVEKCLFAARDSYGIKPLFYFNDGNRILFASRFKALAQVLGMEADWPLEGEDAFLMLGSVYEPSTVVSGINMLGAGHWMMADSKEIRIEKYFSLSNQFEILTNIKTDNLSVIVAAAIAESVKRHLVSDVPVGLLLSSGIDSAAIATVMREQTSTDVTAITIVYDDVSAGRQDESILAKKLSNQLGFRHVVRTVTKEEFLTDLPAIIRMMDQPSIDGLNIWFAAKAVKEQGLKVVISGVGGDELFGGYPSFSNIKRFSILSRLFRCFPFLPEFILIVARILKLRISPKLRLIGRYATSTVGAWLVQRGLWSPSLSKQKIDNFYRTASDRIDSSNLNLIAESRLHCAASILESDCYMRNQLLRDADWAGMAHSVEVRVPLVDTGLLASLAPYIDCLLARPGKQFLSSLIDPSLRALFEERAKTGFTTPVGKWLVDEFNYPTKDEHWSYYYARWLLTQWKVS